MPKITVNITNAEVRRLFLANIENGTYKDDDLVYIARKIMEVVCEKDLNQSAPLFKKIKPYYERFWQQLRSQQKAMIRKESVRVITKHL